MNTENNFDFLVGTWTSTQRRLKKVLAGCEDWYEFDGELRNWNVLGGAGNFDEIFFPSQGFGGAAMRFYDAERDEWSIYWASTKSGMSLPPVVGRFDESGVGTFTSEEVYEGHEIICRYQWSGITPTTAHWEQAFSVDGGATWETNWIADFTRTP